MPTDVPTSTPTVIPLNFDVASVRAERSGSKADPALSQPPLKKVKVGTIDIVGNQAYNDRWVIRTMKNLKPYGIPHSIVAESMIGIRRPSSWRSRPEEPPSSDTVTIAVRLSVYSFRPRRSVDRPVPPPIATIFGPRCR